MARGTFLDEGSIVGGYVSVVGVLLQHVDFQLNFLLFILSESEREERPVSVELTHSHCLGDGEQVITSTNGSKQTSLVNCLLVRLLQQDGKSALRQSDM